MQNGKGKGKNIIIAALIIAICAMSVSYAILAQALTINGTANIDANWDVKFTRIVTGDLDNATVVGTPTASGTSATFEVDLEEPGASAEFDITVENKGTIDAVLASITGVDTANAAEPVQIQYTVSGVDVGDSLLVNGSDVFHVTVTWVASETEIDEIPDEKTKTATITLNYKQKTA